MSDLSDISNLSNLQQCGICLQDFPSRLLMKDGRCEFGMCNECFRKLGTSLCPYCQQPFPWSQTFSSHNISSTGTYGVRSILNLIRSLHDPSVALYSLPPKCLAKGCQAQQVSNELCDYHLHDTKCKKIVTRGLIRVKCNNRANRNGACLTHED